MLLYTKRWFRIARATASAGTAFRFNVSPPRRDRRPIITRLTATNGVTGHTGYVMQTLARTTVASAAAAAQKVVNFTADPGSIATNDWCAFKKPDGTWWIDMVASVATLAVTMTNNVPTGGLAAGAEILFFGIYSDGHESFAIPTSAETTWTDDNGYWGSNVIGEPFIMEFENATNAMVVDGGVGLDILI